MLTRCSPRALCISLKWLIMGTYKTNPYAMWTCFVWTSEFVTATYEQLPVPLLLQFIQGTLLLAPVLRCFGMKIGCGWFLNTTDITEFDLVNIGDYATLNSKVCLQTHLFEDRVMKLDQVFIEDEITIGCASIMLPNTKLGQSAKLGPLSLMINGEGNVLPTKYFFLIFPKWTEDILSTLDMSSQITRRKVKN